MAYTKNTNFTAKDALATGNPNKIIKGSEIDAEFDEIATEDALNAKLAATQTFAGDNDFPAAAPGLTRGGNEVVTIADTDTFTNYISGLTLSLDTDTDHDINVTAGSARDSADGKTLVLSSEITKQIDATWATGDDAGGLSSSLTAPANNTCYHVFLVEIAGSVDVLFDTSLTCANGVTDHSVTEYRRIGSVRTDGSANIRAFVQDGIEFIFAVPVADVSADNPGTSAVTHTLTVPTGVRVDAIITGYLDWVTSGTALHRIFTTDETDAALSTANASFRTRTALNTTPGFGRTRIKTNTSGQIKTRHDVSAVGDKLYINTVGWVDTAIAQGN